MTKTVLNVIWVIAAGKFTQLLSYKHKIASMMKEY